VEGYSERGNEPSGSIKCKEFPDEVRQLTSEAGICSMELTGWLIRW
jgi:hypothetical protein